MSLTWGGKPGHLIAIGTRATEQWLALPGYEGRYEVSDLGRVRSLTRAVTNSNGYTQTLAGRILKGGYIGAGYPGVSLTVDRTQRTHTVHSLVLLAFVGPKPDGMEIRHLSGDKTDNRLINLAYGTRSENMRDSITHGTFLGAGFLTRTRCSRNHELTPDNTGWGGGYRYCRTCKRMLSRARNARIRALKQGATL